MGIAMIVTSIPLLIFAIVFSKGKGIGMIAGYNTMSNEKRAQYDEVAVCKFTGKIMYGACICLWIIALGELLFESRFAIGIGITLTLLMTIFIPIYTNKNRDRFKKTKNNG